MKYLLILLLSINLCFAQTIKPITKGQPSPIDGFVIDKKFEQDRRQDRELLDLEKDKNRVLRELGKVREGREEFYKEEAREAKKEVLKGQFKTVLYFVLGTIVGGSVLYLGSKIK